LSGGLTGGVGHTIVLEPITKPTHSRPYNLSVKEKDEVKRQVAKFLARGLIEPSNSPYGAFGYLYRNMMGHCVCSLTIYP